MKTWDYYGKHDPYYGVLTSEEYRSARLTPETRRRFFASGVRQVEQFIGIAEKAFGPLRNGAALDYGCGVGRLTLALANRFQTVWAVDISDDMLAEARQNLSHCSNVAFERADAVGTSPVDFVLSKIVFQHIPPAQGVEILACLARRLVPQGGAGVIDFPIAYTGGKARALLRMARRLLSFGRPQIPMYVYDLAQIQHTLRDAGCEQVIVETVETHLFTKAIVAFRR